MRALFSSKLPAIMATLFLSAVMHEYLLAMSLGFASPVLLIEFAGLGGLRIIMSYQLMPPTCMLCCPCSYLLLHACLCLTTCSKPRGAWLS